MSKDASFAKAFEELEAITKGFEKGSFDLDEGLKQFERGLGLAATLKKKLSDVENKVEVIKKKFGSMTTSDTGPNAIGGNSELPF